MSPRIEYDALICDLGDVFLFWSAETDTSVTPATLRCMMKSTIWHDYECGLQQEEECYQKLAAEFAFDADEIRHTFHQARKSIRPDHECVSFVHRLKEQFHDHLRIFAMTNMSLGEYTFIRDELLSWGIFEDIFASCEVGMRKPDRGFYDHVLSRVGVDPCRALFIDDKVENVVKARSLGMNGIVFDSLARVRESLLQELVGDIHADDLDLSRSDDGRDH